jgi:hypothetical protein
VLFSGGTKGVILTPSNRARARYRSRSRPLSECVVPCEGEFVYLEVSQGFTISANLQWAGDEEVRRR